MTEHDENVLQQTETHSAALPEDSNLEKHDGRNILRVHVATPAYDGKVDSDFASSMLMAGQICSLQMIEVSAAIIGNGAFIEIARNVLVKEFLEAERLKDFTHFMFIDSDLWFEPRAIAGLVRSGLPVVCGAYRRRQEEESFPVKWTPMPGSKDRLWMNGGWLRTERVPTGFLCIERGVLERMTELAREEGRIVNLPDKGPTPFLFYTKIDEQDRFVGEDFCWSDDYMRLFEAGDEVCNEPIWCWPDFDFVHGGYECNFQEYLARKVKEYGGKRRLGQRRKGA